MKNSDIWIPLPVRDMVERLTRPGTSITEQQNVRSNLEGIVRYCQQAINTYNRNPGGDPLPKKKAA